MRRVILSCVAGSSLEWYDFALYGYFAAILGRLFFPAGDSFQQLIASFGAFASGLLARPIGAVLFGYIGDKWGRKKSLLISIYLMAIPTAAMALLPTYESIGIWAGILLTLIRILQGLALGGGFTGTIVFLYEHSHPEKRGTYSSWAPFSLVFGFVLGSLMATLMATILSDADLESWGWRIPFGISFVGTFVAKYVQNRLQDPKAFVEMQKKDQEKQETVKEEESRIKYLFANHWKAVCLVIWIDVLTACGYFLLSVFFPTYFDEILAFDRDVSFRIISVNMIMFSLIILFGGWLSDRVDRRKQMIVASLALAAFAYPVFSLFKMGAAYAMLGHLGLIFLFSIYYGPIPAAICSIFPMKTRFLGISVAHNIAMAVFGAYAPTIATYMIKCSGDVTKPAILFVISSAFTALGLYIWTEGKTY